MGIFCSINPLLLTVIILQNGEFSIYCILASQRKECVYFMPTYVSPVASERRLLILFIYHFI